MKQNSIGLLLIDKHILFIEGIRALIEQQSRFHIAGSYTDSAEGLKAFKSLKPDITIISDFSNDPHIVTMVHEMVLYRRDAKILILANTITPFTVIETIKAGISGFISRGDGFADFTKALECVYEGQTYFCDQASHILARNLTSKENEISHHYIFNSLTTREKEVMISLLGGMSIREVADSLNISRKTVTTHKAKVYRKFGISSIIEFVRIGNELGL